MKIQDMPFIGKYDHRPEKIVRAAVNTIGEDLNFVLWRLEKLTRSKKLNLACPTVTEWFYLCRLLYLDLEAVSK